MRITPLIAASILVLTHLNGAETNFPPVKSPSPGPRAGAGIQRSMALLASSTPAERHTVRVLFYGQSITEQAWWKAVAADLRHRFPNANLVIENRAIGGHSAQLLVKTAEADLYPFYPDLLIFHVYGSHLDYEKIIRRVRERTTADIVMTTDHITRDDALGEVSDPAKLNPSNWDAFMNHKFLPETAATYGVELIDVRAGWKSYLRENALGAKDLLKDGVHLNRRGEFVMAELVSQGLRAQAVSPPAQPDDRARTYVVGRDIVWREGKLVCDCDGNRIDAILAPGANAQGAVMIDGRKPSTFPELYQFSRVSAFPQSSWPLLLKVGAEAPLQAETWTLTIHNVSGDGKIANFSVAGSVTGPDGSGASTERFVSQSRRIVIEPGDWNLEYCYKVFKRPLPAGHGASWKVVPLLSDALVTVAAEPNVEPILTLAQGLQNTRHRLELTAKNTAGVRAIRVYRPLLDRK
jgi:hypothetical protein